MADADANNTYRRHPQLVDTLPPKVRRQRRLQAKLAPLEAVVEQEKATRKEIDALLAATGYTQRGAGVTCLGYDVVHRERDGNVSYDVLLIGQILVEQLVALGVAREDVGVPETGTPGTEGYRPASDDYVPGATTRVVEAIAAGRAQGDRSQWAEVKPMKGAQVRTR